MIARDLGHDVLSSLKQFPVVALLGPRQCGKTTLARSLQRAVGKPTVYLDLELPSDAARLSDPELYLRSLKSRLVVLDEIQRQPGLFQVLRALVDEDRRPGRYLLLGSASGELLRQSAESLAGRLEYMELTPFLLEEVLNAAGAMSMPAALHRLWLRGGYPLSYLAKSADASRRWRQSFIATYLERDIPQLGLGLPAVQLRRFWEMLAHLSGQIWNASRVASSLGVSAPTARRYLDVLEGTFIARQLQPYHPRSTKRLVKAPKVYLRDTGILHELLRIEDVEALLGHPAAGPSWEGFVIEQTLSRLPRDWSAHFYRTHAGTEIDLVLVRPRGRPIAVEIKLSSAPRITAGTLRGMEELRCERGYVVVPPGHRGDDSPFPIHAHVDVISLPRWIGELARLARGK
jgi:hypothetical protein